MRRRLPRAAAPLRHHPDDAQPTDDPPILRSRRHSRGRTVGAVRGCRDSVWALSPHACRAVVMRLSTLSRLGQLDGEAVSAPGQALIASTAPVPVIAPRTRLLPARLPRAIPGGAQLLMLVRHRLQRLSFVIVVLLP